ncbi:hypothetical protein MTO96_024900 [Rhipicephalus appendiculatus]
MLNPVLLFAQVLLLLRSATQQADNGFTPPEEAAWCLDVRKFHEIYGSTERAIVAEGAWTAKALGSSTSTQGAVSSSQDAICAVSGLGSTGETRMLNPVLLFAQVLLLLRSATQQADNGFTPPEEAAWCLDVRKFHQIYGSTERAIVAEGAWTAKALG